MKLKHEIQADLNLATSMLDERKDVIDAQRKEMSGLRDRIKEFKRLQNNVDEAKHAIRAIVSVNCADQVHWREHAYHMIERANSEGKEIPEGPKPTDLFTALDHLGDILDKRIEEQEENRPGMGMYR